MIGEYFYHLRRKLRKNEVKVGETTCLDTRLDLVVILTQFKRNNLEAQLKSIQNQTRKPDRIYVFQNGDFVDINDKIEGPNVYLVKSDFNTKYFGRFAYCFTFRAENIIIMDDDIIPGKYCFEHYLSELDRLNSIIGGNGRIATINENFEKLIKPPDVGIRPKTTKVDFVGHLWCFKQEWLKAMFITEPLTLETGEDMHFCFSAKLHFGIQSYVASQPKKSTLSDISHNYHGTDENASYKTTTNESRIDVEKYFASLGLKFIKEN